MLIAVEQLRRNVPGGIGNYARGLLAGLQRCAEDGDGVEVTLLASRPPRGAPDPLAAYGLPVVASALPGRLMTRAWDHSLLRATGGLRRGPFGLLGGADAAARQSQPSRRDGPRPGLAPPPRGDDEPGPALARGRAPARPRLRRRPSSCRPASSPRTSSRSAPTRRGSPSCAVAPTTWRHPTRTPPPRCCGGWVWPASTC